MAGYEFSVGAGAHSFHLDDREVKTIKVHLHHYFCGARRSETQHSSSVNEVTMGFVTDRLRDASSFLISKSVFTVLISHVII